VSINQPRPSLVPLSVSISWTPWAVNPPATWVAGGITFPYARQADAVTRASDSRYAAYKTPTNTPITFTANAKTDALAPVIEYRWDFGDGSLGYGQSITKSFVVGNVAQTITVRVLDARGRVASSQRPMLLYAATSIVAGTPITV
jgi:hypothetical protein